LTRDGESRKKFRVGQRWIGVGAVVLALLAGACASQGQSFGFKPDRVQERQVQQEYAPYRQRSSAVISGRAWIDMPSGERVLANRRLVRLTPITSVSREYVREAMETGDWSSQVLARDRAVVWSTRTDEQGRFWFNQLPSGDYYIIAHAGWTDSAGHPQTTILVVEVHLTGGEERDVVLAGRVEQIPPSPR